MTTILLDSRFFSDIYGFFVINLTRRHAAIAEKIFDKNFNMM